MSPRVRSAALLGVVVLMLLAGYGLQKLADRGEGSPDVPASELTPAEPASPTSIPTAVAAQSPQIQTAIAQNQTTVAGRPTSPSVVRRDLAADEARGGHTVARHVGKTDDDLRRRLDAEPDISAASTYTNLATAERAVARVLEAKKSDLQKWEARTGNRPNLALRASLGETIGRSMKRGQSKAVNVDSAVVVLRWNGDGWYVLTSYPEDR